LIDATHLDHGGALEIEYIDGLVSLREYYLAYMKGASSDLSIFAKAGRALGSMHSSPPPEAKNLPDPMPPLMLDSLRHTGAENSVMIHGDFGFSNVFWSAEAAQIVLLDASPNYFVSQHPLQVATPYADIGHFVSCLCGLVPARNFLSMRWPRAAYAVRAFLDGYSEVSGFSPDYKTVFKSAHLIADAYFRYRYPLGLRRALSLFWISNRVRTIGRLYERL
jgi:hypothetical protein